MVSVIIPTYNRATVLEKSINSVRKQTYQDIEIIIVDDGSSDDTELIVKCIMQKDGRIRYIKNQCNLGVAGARNVGIQHAKGEFIAFNDSDDVWHKDKLEKQLALFQGTDYMLVYCAFSRTMLNRETIRVPAATEKRVSGKIFSRLLEGNLVSTQTIVMKKECVSKVGYFNSKIKALDDYEYVLRVAEKYEIGYVDKELVDVATFGDSISLFDTNYIAIFGDVIELLSQYWNKYNDKMEPFLRSMYQCLQKMNKSEFEHYKQYAQPYINANDATLNIMSDYNREMRRLRFKDSVMRGLLEDKGQQLETYMKKNEINHVALYGMGYIGKCLLDKLRNCDVSVKYGIDKRCTCNDYPVFHPEDELPEVDMVIISVFDEEENIRKQLESKVNCKVAEVSEIL